MGLSLSHALRSYLCPCAVVLVLSNPLFSEKREVIIDNAKVQVLRILVEPGETADLVDQKMDSVVIWPQAGSAETVLPDGKSAKISWKQNEADWQPAGSSRPMRLEGKISVPTIVVELKGNGEAESAPKSPQNPWIVDPKHYKVEFENSKVRVTRVTIGPKESTPLHEHSLDRVVVYLTPLDFQIDPEGQPPQHSVQKAGAIAWGVPARHAEHNLLDKGFEGIVVEPKY